MAKRSVLLWALVAIVVALILFRKPSFANVREPPNPGASRYFIKPGESCAEGYTGPVGDTLKCEKK
jgi:hypothetical protein